MEHRKAKLAVLREAGHLFLPFEHRINVHILYPLALTTLALTTLAHSVHDAVPVEPSHSLVLVAASRHGPGWWSAVTQ